MRVALKQGAYQSRSLSASAQRCVNLYPEINPEDSVFPTTQYLTPGLKVLATPAAGPERLEYTASNGAYYRVVGNTVYSVSSSWVHTALGTIANLSTPCYMADNGSVIVLVDGTADGYVIDMNTNTFGQIVNPSWYGSVNVQYLDTFFLFNRPDTDRFYTSQSSVTFVDFTTTEIIAGVIDGGTLYTNGVYPLVPLSGGSGSGAVATITITGGSVTGVTVTNPGIDYAVGDVLTVSPADVGGTGSGFTYTLTTAGAFNSLDVATPGGAAGDIQNIIVAHRNVWLFKNNYTEVWYDTGAADFAFGPAPGVLIEHGIAAKYSLCSYDGNVYWVGRDKAGTAIIFTGAPYEAKRISTHAIENAISQYSTITDAVGFIYQQGGHTFYQITFPSADATWVYDLATQLWHERAWIDGNGNEHRHRALLGTNAYGTVVVGDWETGQLYQYDLDTYTDNGDPIVRRRGWPHIAQDGNRLFYRTFIPSMDTGKAAGLMLDDEPMISLRWSDTLGNSWGNPISTGFGATGQYLRQVQFQRLGMARDRVFEVFWSAPVPTALNGAFIDFNGVRT